MREARPEATPASQLSRRRHRRAGHLLAWTLLAALHLVLIFAFVPPRELFSHQPIAGIDYSLHYYQVDRAVSAFRQTGHLWSWDPAQLAGLPAGTAGDTSSKLLVLFVIALTSLGVSQGLAFNLFILLAHLLFPWLGLAAARLFDLRGRAAFVLVLLWVLLWHFDSFIHWCWYCGMLTWPLASGLAVVVVGMAHRVLQRFGGPPRPPAGPAERLPRWWLAAALGCGLAGLLHPLAIAVIALPCAALYLRARGARLRVHLFASSCALAALGALLVWVLPALPVWHHLASSEVFLRPTPLHLLSDFFELHLSATATAPPVQTGLRFLCLTAAAIALWRFRRESDARYLPLLVMVASGLLIAYAGRYLWVTSTAQPYRAVVPATLAAALPAALLLSELFSRRTLASLSPLALVLLVIGGVLLLPRVTRTFLYYFPDLRPFIYFERRLPVPEHPINRVLAAHSRKMENRRPAAFFPELAEWLRANHRGRGRVLVQDYETGEYLAVHSGLPVIGGFAYRPLAHADANLFRNERRLALSDQELRAYFERYAVGFVVLRRVHWSLENKTALLRFRRAFGDLELRVFETTIQPDYLLRGRGRVVRQALNQVVVEGAAGPEVVLRFHWLGSLRCRPGCTAEPAPVEGDRVGFIRVRRPPPRFEIYNSYEFPSRGS